MGCSRSEKNGATTSHSKTVTTQLPTRLLGNTNIDRTRPFEGSRLTLCAQLVIHLKKFQGRPLTAKALSGKGWAGRTGAPSLTGMGYTAEQNRNVTITSTR